MERWRRSPELRVLPFLFLVLVASLAGAAELPWRGLVSSHPLLVVPIFAAMLLLEKADLKVVSRNRTYLYGLGEVPVLLGLCCVGLPLTLLARTVSNAAWTASRRMPPVKVAGNAVLKVAELTTIAGVLALFLRGGDPTDPSAWPAVPVARSARASSP